LRRGSGRTVRVVPPLFLALLRLAAHRVGEGEEAPFLPPPTSGPAQTPRMERATWRRGAPRRG
jgi:hypothetical protein